MNTRTLTLCALMGLAVVTGGCAGGKISPEAQAQANTQADLDSLKSQVRRLQSDVDDMRAAVNAAAESGGKGATAELSNRVTRLEGLLNQAASRLNLDLGAQSSAPAAHGPASPGQDDDGPSSSGSQAPGAPTGLFGGSPQAQAQQPAAQAPASTPEAVYDKALNLFNNRDYPAALSLFTEFVKAYPKHNLAGNAVFWRGESLFQTGDYAGAALAYQDVVDKYPKSPKIASAMYKQGQAFLKMGKKDAGKVILQAVAAKFPDSVEGKRAKQDIAGIR